MSVVRFSWLRNCVVVPARFFSLLVIQPKRNKPFNMMIEVCFRFWELNCGNWHQIVGCDVWIMRWIFPEGLNWKEERCWTQTLGREVCLALVDCWNFYCYFQLVEISYLRQTSVAITRREGVQFPILIY